MFEGVGCLNGAGQLGRVPQSPQRQLLFMPSASNDDNSLVLGQMLLKLTSAIEYKRCHPLYTFVLLP